MSHLFQAPSSRPAAHVLPALFARRGIADAAPSSLLGLYPVGESTRSRLRRQLGFSQFTILALGRTISLDAWQALLEAFAVVARREPAARLHLAVEHPDSTFAEREVRRALRHRAALSVHRGRIQFGALPAGSARPDHYRAADLFVSLDPDGENPARALEAMACGTPTVLSDALPASQHVAFGRHALIADSADPLDVGMTMLQVQRHPRVRARLARMGAQYVRSFLAWSGVAANVDTACDHGASVARAFST